MAEPIRVGSIIHLANGAPNGGYLDVRGWVADKPAFWNVSGTERCFVSTHGSPKRDGGSTGSWKIISAEGKPDDAPLYIGDTIHLLNLFPDAGYLDCCGWVEHLAAFSAYKDDVTCGVFTTRSPDRDSGTGRWTVRSVGNQKQQGDPLLAGDAICLENDYPKTGFLLAHGKVTENATFTDYAGQRLFAFTHASEPQADVRYTWTLSLRSLDDESKPLIDLYRPDLLRGRSDNMKSVIRATNILLGDAFEAVSGLSLEEVTREVVEANKAGKTGEEDGPFQKLLTKAKSGEKQSLSDVIDHDFQIKQLLNLYTLSQMLDAFDRETLYPAMSNALTQHEPDKSQSPLYLLRRCFQHTATDHEIIQRAAVQRRWNHDPADGNYHQSEQAVELVVMDKLALKAISPFRALLSQGASNPAVITYFSDTTHVHRVPYTGRFILIGVNYDRIAPAATESDAATLTPKNFSAFELMAIPHEVGHYVYQHSRLQSGKFKGKRFAEVSKQFADNPYYRWCEEIFADLYGCIVAGPLSVFSMQTFLASGDTERAWKDDAEHPAPLLRAYLLSEILRLLSAANANPPRRYEFEKVTKKLDEDWTQNLRDWGYEQTAAGNTRPARLYLPDNAAIYLDRVVNVERVLRVIRPIIEEFADHLLGAVEFGDTSGGDSASTTIPWSGADEERVEKYAERMAILAGRDTARQEIPLSISLDTTPDGHAVDASLTAVEQLKWYLENWGDSGPFGIGGH